MPNVPQSIHTPLFSKTFAMAALLISCLLYPQQEAKACTAFLLSTPKKKVMGKSYDWHTSDGLIMVNKRAVAKRAFAVPTGYRVTYAKWTSLYGSVTFNQYGREMPLGGLNEKGLAIEVLWLRSTSHGALKKNVPTLNELQWIQYHLDTSASVPEMIKSAKKLQIARIYGSVHYFACDRQGRCATFEYLKGRLVIHKGKTLPFPALTNHTYHRSIRYLKKHKGFGGKRKIPKNRYSLPRFCRAAAAAKSYNAKKGPQVPFALSLLKNVRMGSYSKWHIVYDLEKWIIYFRNAHQKKTIAIHALKQDYNCKTAVKVMDLQGSVSKKLHRKWGLYSHKLNHKLIKTSFSRLSSPFPNRLLRYLAYYPRLGTKCTK